MDIGRLGSELMLLVWLSAWEVIDRADEGYGSDDDYYDMGGDYLESRQGREEIVCRPGFTWNNVKCVGKSYLNKYIL